VAWLALVIVVAGAAGVATHRRMGAGAVRLSRGVLKAMLFVVGPLIAYANLAHLDVDAGLGVAVILGWLALLATGAVAWVAGRRGLGMSRPSTGTLSGAAMMANSGFLGVPVCAAVLGPGGLRDAVAYDALVQQPLFFTAVFAVAAATGTKAGETAAQRARAFFVRNPPLVAAAAGLLVPAALAPPALLDVTHVLVYALPVMGFFAVGIALADESGRWPRPFPPPFTSRVGLLVALRLALAPLLLLGLGAALVDLPTAWIVVAAMPIGVNAVTVAHVYGLDLPLAASALAWTTAIGLAGTLAVVVIL
jgi:predicted permease